MVALIIGLVLVVLKLLNVPFVGELSWFIIGIPFALAAIWWSVVSPLLGLRRRKAVEDVESRRKKIERERRQRLGYKQF